MRQLLRYAGLQGPDRANQRGDVDMHAKLALAMIAGFLPILASGAVATQDVSSLRLKIVCRSDAVVILDKAVLLEDRIQKDGTIPDSAGSSARRAVRLNMPDGGTLTIPWENIVKIAVAV